MRGGRSAGGSAAAGVSNTSATPVIQLRASDAAAAALNSAAPVELSDTADANKLRSAVAILSIVHRGSARRLSSGGLSLSCEEAEEEAAVRWNRLQQLPTSSQRRSRRCSE